MLGLITDQVMKAGERLLFRYNLRHGDMTPKLELRGLGKTFGEGARQVEALHDIDLTLADNEFVSLVGTSGCGKSTLLSIVAGLQDFDHGELLVDGAPVTGPGLDRGVVFQSYTLAALADRPAERRIRPQGRGHEARPMPGGRGRASGAGRSSANSAMPIRASSPAA